MGSFPETYSDPKGPWVNALLSIRMMDCGYLAFSRANFSA